jgi:MEMO1 family protein
MTTISPIRPSPIAGSWYPGNAKVLREEVSGYIDEALPQELNGKVIGIIVPHAGYKYSGPTAGYGYRCISGMSFERVAVVSPLHEYNPHPLLTSAHEHYATPLGTVKVDHICLDELNQALLKKTGTQTVAIANDHEHSLEIQLPFLQCALAAPFELIPLMVREQAPAALKSIGECLAEVVKGKNTLLVASTDLSHFFSEKEANQLDQHMLKKIGAFSPDGVLQAEDERTGFACGSGAVAVVLWAARALGATKVTILHHSTSADATGDTSQVVGYGAAAILQ